MFFVFPISQSLLHSLTLEEMAEEHTFPTEITVNAKARDEALDFLEKFKDEAGVALSHDATCTYKLRRKVDIYVISFMMAIYALNFLDKVLLNVRHTRLQFLKSKLTSRAVFECHGPVPESKA